MYKTWQMEVYVNLVGTTYRPWSQVPTGVLSCLLWQFFVGASDEQLEELFVTHVVAIDKVPDVSACVFALSGQQLCFTSEVNFNIRSRESSFNVVDIDKMLLCVFVIIIWVKWW